MKTKLALLLFCTGALALLGWFFFEAPGGQDQAEVRKILRSRNVALQSGNGAGYDALIYYPGLVERTAAFSIAQAVTARAAFLRAVATLWGSPVAVRMGQRLAVLREFTPKEINSCRIGGRGNLVLAEISAESSLAFRKTAEGWKLDLFESRSSDVMARLSSASVAFDAACAQLRRGRFQNPEAALKFIQQRVLNDPQGGNNSF